VRAAYEQFAEPDYLLLRLRELSARTVIVDVEPLVAYWDSSLDHLDQGITSILGRLATGSGVRVVCFATNSARRPSVLPGSLGLRVLYLASAGKPVRTAPYRGLPGPGVVVGDQVATDGLLAWRLNYTFLHYTPHATGPAPLGPRLMKTIGQPLRPLLFHRS
jgi:predicted HAD superfamily phosphohydrolase YqeG